MKIPDYKKIVKLLFKQPRKKGKKNIMRKRKLICREKKMKLLNKI